MVKEYFLLNAFLIGLLYVDVCMRVAPQSRIGGGDASGLLFATKEQLAYK